MLKSRIFLSVLVLAVSMTVGQQPQKSCRAHFSDMNRKQLKWINDCVKQLGYKTAREKTQKSTCVMKCVLENLKMLNDDGRVDEASFENFLKENWPEYLQDKGRAALKPCRDIAGANADLSDELCKGYDPLVKCLTRNFANLCRGT